MGGHDRDAPRHAGGCGTRVSAADAGVAHPRGAEREWASPRRRPTVTLAARVCAAAAAGGDDVVRRRVFDALGALAVGHAVPDHAVFDAFDDRGLLADVRRLCAVVRSTEVDDLDRLSCTTPGAVAVPVALLVAAARGLGSPAVVAGV